MEIIRELRIKRGLSQRELARLAGVSFSCVQQIERRGHNWRMASIQRIINALDGSGKNVEGLVSRALSVVDDSVEDASLRMVEEGFASWKIHLFNLIDRFRATHDASLIARPPVPDLDERLLALLASTVESLCAESGLKCPPWCSGVFPLRHPWFVSGMQNLRAMALVESPATFRRRNLFVLANFLDRA